MPGPITITHRLDEDNISHVCVIVGATLTLRLPEAGEWTRPGEGNATPVWHLVDFRFSDAEGTTMMIHVDAPGHSSVSTNAIGSGEPLWMLDLTAVSS
jgi:hypothetical protein